VFLRIGLLCNEPPGLYRVAPYLVIRQCVVSFMSLDLDHTEFAKLRIQLVVSFGHFVIFAALLIGQAGFRFLRLMP
jgi:hypothetical protein